MSKGSRWNRRQDCAGRKSTADIEQHHKDASDDAASTNHSCGAREPDSGFSDAGDRQLIPQEKNGTKLLVEDITDSAAVGDISSGYPSPQRLWRRRVSSNEEPRALISSGYSEWEERGMALQCASSASSQSVHHRGDYIKLRKGTWMPKLGLGTGSEPLEPGVSRRAVVSALQQGYRMIDLNVKREKEAAEAVQDCCIHREDIFLLTKLAPQDHGNVGRVTAACRASLRQLGVDFVDLYLLTSPRGGRLIETWKAMLHLCNMAFVRAVGVSNFGVHHLQGLQSEGLELPEVNQVELHVWWQQRELAHYCEAHGITLMAYSSVGRGRMFGRGQLSALAERLDRKEADLCLRWCMQKGHAVVPKSFDPEHIAENLSWCIDLRGALSSEVMSQLNTIDSGIRVCEGASRAQDLSWEDVAWSVPNWQALERKVSTKG